MGQPENPESSWPKLVPLVYRLLSCTFHFEVLPLSVMTVRTETGQISGEKAACSRPAKGDSVSVALEPGTVVGANPVEFDVRVVGLAEDDLWYAQSLELNLLGYGDSFDEALEQLKGAIDAQVCYAALHNCLDQISWSASQRYFDLYSSRAKETPRRKLRVSVRRQGVLMQATKEKFRDDGDIISEISKIT